MATKANLVIDQGTTFSATITMTDDNGNLIDLSAYTARSQIRKHYTSTTAVNFTTEITVSTAEITLSLTDVQTANLTAGRYVYDVEVVDSYANTVSRVVEGIVTVTPNVTR
jgi:hypothetical protein